MDRGRKGEGVTPGIYAHDVGFCICICSAHGILSGCVHYLVHIRGGVSATASPDELPSPYSYNSYISSHHPHCPSCQVGIIIYSWALGEGCDLDIQSPFHPSVNPKVVRTYLKPSVRSRRSRLNDPTDTSHTLKTSNNHEILVLFLFPTLHTTTSSSSSRQHSPLLPPDHLLPSALGKLELLHPYNTPRHHTTSCFQELHKPKCLPAFLNPQSVLCLPMLPAIVCYDRPPLALPCEHKMQIWPPCLLASDFPNLRVNQTIVTAHPVIEFLPM